MPNYDSQPINKGPGHDHDVEIFWNMVPFVFIMWPIALPLNLMLWPFTIITIPFVLIWNMIAITALATPPLIIYLSVKMHYEFP